MGLFYLPFIGVQVVLSCASGGAIDPSGLTRGDGARFDWRGVPGRGRSARGRAGYSRIDADMLFSPHRFPVRIHRQALRRLLHEKTPRRRTTPKLELLESRQLLATFIVTNTADNGNNANPTAGSLRAAIVNSNLDTPGPNHVVFEISSADSGFSPTTQDWTIHLANVGLPPITTPVDIDGFTQAFANSASYRYPAQYTSEVQALSVDPAATSGSFQLTVGAYVDDNGVPRGGGSTVSLAYDATAGDVQGALEALVGQNNVVVTGTSVNDTGGLTITFQGASTGLPIVMSSTDPIATLGEVTVGGVANGNPTQFTSSPNTIVATSGNNAVNRVIVDGSLTSGATGFQIDASDTTLRGLIIDGFGTGVEVAAADLSDNPVRGVLVQGNFIGEALLYLVDPITGIPLAAPDNEAIDGVTNSGPGVMIEGLNTIVGGPLPQDDNVISGDGGPGVVIEPTAEGNELLENQIGVIGPSGNGIVYGIGNGAQGVLVESSSNLIGGANLGNVISDNAEDGVEVLETAQDGATQNVIAGNLIGTVPGGGYLFGSGDPGNRGNGVEIQNAANNVIGGTSTGAGNVISANTGAGVDINGVGALGNVIAGNIIGLMSGGSDILGNDLQGVAVSSSDTQIGPGNVISGNQNGISITGAEVVGVTVIGNLIGTDSTGEIDLGNAFDGVLVDGANGVTIQGNASGSQVISGNTVGIDIVDSQSDLIEGNFVGTDKTGTLELPNSQQGVLINGSSNNTIGGTSASSKNLISSNHTGLEIENTSSDNLVEGNLVGTDITGKLPLGNEVDGVTISNSSGNTIGGTLADQGNTIAFNSSYGIELVSGDGDAFLSNAIFSNGANAISAGNPIGIYLWPGSNQSITAPELATATPNLSSGTTTINGSYSGQSSTRFLIQFFSNSSADPAGQYEGQTLLGSTIVTTDAQGNATISVSIPSLVTAGYWITATATYLATTNANPAINAVETSTFSSQVVQAFNVLLVTNTSDDVNTTGSLPNAITASNTALNNNPYFPNVIEFQIPGTGLQTIELSSELPEITEPVVIDGYSQPGSETNSAGSTYQTGDTKETDVASIEIQIDGSEITANGVNGLTIDAQNCTIDGLSITGFSGGAGIAIVDSPSVPGLPGDTIWGNFIGVTQFNPTSFNPVAATSNLYANGVGISITGAGNFVGGPSPIDRNVIQGNLGAGVMLSGAAGTGNAVGSNFILDNGSDGVLVSNGASSNSIGLAIGQGPDGGGNVISGNQGNGVHILGALSQGNSVSNNEIGTQVGQAGLLIPIRGTLPRPNKGDGILVEDGGGNVIGGQATDSGNVIAGNSLNGVAIVDDSGDSSATQNRVQGNDIGFNNRNQSIYLIPNFGDGVLISASNNIIGGDSTAATNIIIDNGQDGVAIVAVLNVSAVGNLIDGNDIGTQSGTNQYGNTIDGIYLSGATDTTIGGTTSGGANVIAGNHAGVVIQSGGSNLLVGNLIGLSADGSNALGNAQDGITISNSSGNTIGGTATGTANDIAGNGGAGIDLTGNSTSGTLIQGNLIGTNPSGSDSLGNSSDGVLVQNSSSSNTIGGTAAGAANTISNNLGSGIAIESGQGNAILSNSIVGNGVMGINLAAGANDGIATPALTAAIPNSVAGTTNVQWNYTAQVGGTFVFQFFSNTSADSSGNFEGQTLLGTVTLTVVAGANSFSEDLAVAVASGQSITATVTYQGAPSLLTPGDSSAFSGAVPALAVVIQFASAETTPQTTPGTVVIPVERTGNTAGAVSVTFATADGSAVEGVDYKAASGTLTFASGVTTQSIDITLLDARVAIGDFTFTVSLSSPAGGATLGATSTTTVIINEDNQTNTYFVDTALGTSIQDGPYSGSLAWAIAKSNANPSPSIASPNLIVFDIPGTGVQTIQPTSPLVITAPVIIDGYSQPGSQTNSESTGDNATILIQVDGSTLAGNDNNGLSIYAHNCMVDGLIITGFSGAGIAIDTPPPSTGAIGSTIWGNFIGVAQYSNSQSIIVDPTRNPGANQAGILVDFSNNDIGGTLPVSRNVIQGNTGAGVILYGPGGTGNLVQSNFILDNGGDGVLVLSANNEIGQPVGVGSAGAGDVISGNHSNGVFILGSAAQGNIVANDLIGTSPDGTENFGNHGNGVLIENAPGNVVGGTGTNMLNVIGGNGGDGVLIENDQGDALPPVPSQVSTALADAGYTVDQFPTSATANRVQGNWIGFYKSSDLYLIPNTDGVFISSSDNTVGGTTTSAQNIIIANNRDGVVVSSEFLDPSNNTLSAILNADPVLNVIAGNFIGTQGGGDDYGNTLDGIFLYGATNNTIGGSVSGSLNVISGNNNGVVIQGGGSNALIANDIGTTSDGSQPLANAVDGITLEDSTSNTIGGPATGLGNLISGNVVGVHITGSGSSGNVLWGNLIGTDEQGTGPLRNTSDGVLIDGGASNNTIGGTGSNESNTIAFNTGDGILVISGIGDAILTNSIFSNGLIGISLSDGANDSILPPTLTGALPDTALNSTNIEGTYTGQPNSSYLIQFFSNTVADPSGNYEGQTFIGSTTLKTNASGEIIGNPNGTFSVDIGTVVSAGSWITATVTFLSPPPSPLGLTGGDTSEFTGAVEAINPFLVTTTADSNTLGTLRYAITYANANPSPSVSIPNQIQFQISGGGLQTIELTSILPTIVQPIVIDGYSQPGSSTNDSSGRSGLYALDDEETDVALLNVQIDGSQLNSQADNGLTIAAANCTVDGLIITGFSGAGIALQPTSSTISGTIGDTIWGNFIGVSQFSPLSFNPVTPAKNPAANGVGLLIDGSNNLIGGAEPPDRNVIQGNSGDGVIVYGTQGTRNTLASNFILDNGGDGVLVLSANNQIGEATAQGPAGAGNVISGNHGNGVDILGPAARGNVVASDEIGTQVGLSGLVIPIRGTQPRPNGGDGVLIENAPANVVGGQIPNAGNVIGGNSLDGVVIENYVSGEVPAIVPLAAGIVVNNPVADGTGNQVQGNYIGFNNRNIQIYAIPNRDGVFISSQSNLVGGNTAAAQNIIVDNDRNGVTISLNQLDTENNPLGVILNANPTLNSVEGNYIGTQAGNTDNGNALDGVLLYASNDNTIGGTASGAGNVISGNNTGIVIQAVLATGNVVDGNLIGLTANGSAPLSNVTDGVEILNSPANIIGAIVAGAGNQIGGTSNGNGVELSGVDTTGNVLWGNFIGTNSEGAELLGNSGDGVAIDANASNNTVGGTITGAGNTIEFNAGTGVGVSSGTGNSILSNSIDSNQQLGIVLSGNGNDGQSAPSLTSAIPASSATLIQGTLSSLPTTTFLIQFFTSPTADPSGYGQGQTLVGSTEVTTTASGQASFDLSLSSLLATGLAVSATATNESTGDSSAFSNDVLTGPVNVEFASASFSAYASSGSATISVQRTGNLGATFTVAYATSNGTAQAGVNYTATQGTLTFNPDQTVETFTVPLATNIPPSGTLTVNLTLSDPTGGASLGTPATSVLTILDNRPILVQFGASDYTYDESAGEAIITVTRNSPSGTSTVEYATGGGTAEPGVEYTPVDGTLTFIPGSTTDSFDVPLEGNLNQAGQWTVGLSLSDPTGAALGDPSQATLNLTAGPGAVEFTTSSVTVPESSGGVLITVNRVGGASGTISVDYAANEGTAIPGVDYTPVSGTLTFAPGVMQLSFILPLVANSTNPNEGTVAVTLSSPGGGATLGSPSVEIVTIDKPLVVTSEQLSINGAGISAVTFAFNKPLNAIQAQNLANFGSFVITSGRGGRFGRAASDFTSIQSAVYNPSNLTVTVTPSAVLPYNHLYRLVINSRATPLLNNGLMSANGDVLAGSNGVAGTPFVTNFGAGTRLVYTDGSGNVVTLKLSRGGLMELYQALDGTVQELELVGTNPKSTLTGTVRRGLRPGQTALPPITGGEGVRIQLKPPAFRAHSTNASVVEAKVGFDARVIRVGVETPRPFSRRRWRW